MSSLKQNCEALAKTVATVHLAYSQICKTVDNIAELNMITTAMKQERSEEDGDERKTSVAERLLSFLQISENISEMVMAMYNLILIGLHSGFVDKLL